MAQDITKNTADVENYSKEFIELQRQLSQTAREKLTGSVSLPAVPHHPPIIPCGLNSPREPQSMTKVLQ